MMPRAPSRHSMDDTSSHFAATRPASPGGAMLAAAFRTEPPACWNC
jgi:hypothetical protein